MARLTEQPFSASPSRTLGLGPRHRCRGPAGVISSSSSAAPFATGSAGSESVVPATPRSRRSSGTAGALEKSVVGRLNAR
jgi:hypothetical protein